MNFQTALLLLISLVFSILGGFIAVNGKTADEKNLGIGCLGLFGLSFVTFVYFAWRKRVFEKQIEENASSISVEGGRKFQIDKSKYYIISIILGFLGSFLAYFVRLNLIFTIATSLMACLGFFVFFGVLFGFLAKEYLIFEFDGIRMGFKNYSYIIRWDNILKFSSDEWHSNMAIFIHLINPEDTTRYLYVSKGRRDKTVKVIYSKISWSLSMAGAHILILPERFGLDAGYFFRMLEGYLKHPERRIELKVKKRIE